MIKILKNPIEQFIGAMFFKLDKEDIFVFEFKKPLKNFFIHTFFCLQPLDIYLLDENWLVIEKITLSTYKFLIRKPPQNIKLLIETSLNTLNINIGDKISMENILLYRFN